MSIVGTDEQKDTEEAQEAVQPATEHHEGVLNLSGEGND